MNDLENRLLDCFCSIFPNRSSEEILAAHRNSIPEWDSLASITLLTLLQQEFHMDVDLMDLEGLDSFSSVLHFVAERTSQREPRDVA